MADGRHFENDSISFNPISIFDTQMRILIPTMLTIRKIKIYQSEMADGRHLVENRFTCISTP